MSDPLVGRDSEWCVRTPLLGRRRYKRNSCTHRVTGDRTFSRGQDQAKPRKYLTVIDKYCLCVGSSKPSSWPSTCVSTKTGNFLIEGVCVENKPRDTITVDVEVVQWKVEACERMEAWVASWTTNKIRRIYCGLLGGVLDACYVAYVSDPQWVAPSAPELKPYA